MDGSSRLDVPYLWPTTLHLPAPRPKLVYLDLNHWIALAKAACGHPDGAQYTEVLEWCSDAVDHDAALFPISAAIITEISRISKHRQRRDLREVIERLSGFFVVTSRVVVAAHEVETLLDDRVGPSPRPIADMNYLDWGVARAFGRAGGFRVVDQDGEDVTAQVRSAHPSGPDAFDAIVEEATVELNRRVIEGPRADEEAQMRALGWDPTRALAITDRRALQEVEQVSRFDDDPTWRRGRIRDVVAARELLIELDDVMARGLESRGVGFGEVFAEPEETRRAMDAMPSFDVAVTLKTSYHRNANHRWTANDIHDIDALASTLPYCDVVVTDRAARSHTLRSGLDDRLGTVVLAELSQVPNA